MADGDLLPYFLSIGITVMVNFLPVCNSGFCSKWFHQNFNSQFRHWRSNGAFLILATVMASTIYFWDYILMFSMEVDLVWKSKWNFMKGLYLFQRYLPFIDITIDLYCRSDFLPIFLP